MKITPSAFLDELHPPATAFTPCSKWEEVRVVHAHKWQTYALSGSLASCMGAMPSLCHEDAATEAQFEFRLLAGIEPPSGLRTYADDDEAARLATEFARSGLRLATTLPLIPEIKALNSALVKPDTHDYLNDKRNFASFCADEFLPVRQVYDRAEIPNIDPATIEYPVFVKGAVEGASGGGLDVRLCRDREELREALAWIWTVPDFKGVVIEAAISFSTSWCLNFAVLDHDIRYLGAAEQLFGSPGLQNGSLIDPGHPPPPLSIEIGKEICRNARNAGYRGVVGFDMCVDAGGRVYFFDLNFRVAGCTAFILLHGGMETSQVGVMMPSNFPGSLTDKTRYLEPFISAGRYVPVALYDGSHVEGHEPFFRLGGFALASSREEAFALSNEIRTSLSSS